jgi:signal transduction histidine kinase
MPSRQVSGDCWLAHDLRNKLAIVVGQCELLIEHALDGDAVQRLQAIHRAAQGMAEALNKHQCQLGDVLRTSPATEATAPAERSNWRT